LKQYIKHKAENNNIHHIKREDYGKMSEYILELKNIVKKFDAITALDNVELKLKRGETLALMGENGAGKSTLIKVITGVHKPDSGTVLVDGEKVEFSSTLDSLKYGIAAIYQHVTSFPDLTVTENIFMGREILTPLGTYNWGQMRKQAKELLKSLSADIDVNKPMETLSVAQQQLVEIAKALSRNARILIMDEPTASLTKHECEELYSIVDNLKEDGVSIIFITHRFEDMYRLCESVTVFRDSKYIGHWQTNEISNEKLIEAMVGRTLTQMYPDKNVKIGQKVLSVKNLFKTGYFKDISFDVHAGEIVAFTGLVGSGRTEVCQSVFGILKADKGEIFINNEKIDVISPTHALKKGIALLPEDRQRQGLIYEFPLYKNVSAAVLEKFSKSGFMDENQEIETAIQLCNKMALKAKDISDTPNALSGGNQQKVVFAKLLNCNLKVLILDEPTKGIDVGAKFSIYQIMNELAAAGYAIIMVSSEMPEVLGVSDRIYVFKSGRITGEFKTKEATQEMLLSAALAKEGGEG